MDAGKICQEKINLHKENYACLASCIENLLKCILYIKRRKHVWNSASSGNHPTQLLSPNTERWGFVFFIALRFKQLKMFSSWTTVFLESNVSPSVQTTGKWSQTQQQEGLKTKRNDGNPVAQSKHWLHLSEICTYSEAELRRQCLVLLFISCFYIKTWYESVLIFYMSNLGFERKALIREPRNLIEHEGLQSERAEMLQRNNEKLKVEKKEKKKENLLYMPFIHQRKLQIQKKWLIFPAMPLWNFFPFFLGN